ncbi:MAG: chromate efflux transporter [Rhodospirillaceae bacterium]|nr:chromate efflux transporter [Rhodospirillaceae bacterium]
MRDVFLIFLRLGLTSFGGPIAHLDIFRREFVAKRQWLDQQTYAEMVAVCSVLPGATSSQVGLSLGHLRGGWRGALAAWAGFTLPSAIIMVAFAFFAAGPGAVAHQPWVHGLKLAAVAIVAHAIWGMIRTYCLNLGALVLAVLIAAVLAGLPTLTAQLATLAFGAVAGVRLKWGAMDNAAQSEPAPRINYALSLTAILIFTALLAALPALVQLHPNALLVIADKFYRAGALVFGGGHVVLPLLHQEFVAPGLIDADTFLAGYGMAQAVPGPLFTFAAYLGGVVGGGVTGSAGDTVAAALVSLVMIFLPSVLLVAGAVPLLRGLQRHVWARHMLAGINVAVVGFLMAAFATPILPTAIQSFPDIILAAVGLALLFTRKVPSWAVVLLCAGVAQGYAWLA